MSMQHSGNGMLNEMTFEEHDGTNNAKRVNVVAGGVGLATITLVSTPTLFAVVNTAAAGQASVVLDTGVSFIGIVTVTNKDRAITGNLTLSDSKTFIGLTTTTLGASPAFIGLATVNIGSSNTTLFAVVNTAAAGQSSVVLDTGVSFIGIVTVANKDRTLTGNVTISDSKGFIGLTTTTLGASSAFIGIVTVTNAARTITGNLTLSDSKTFIGLTTTTLGASPAFVGIVTISNKDRTITGNLTLSDSKTFIGLTTTVNAASPAFIGIVTVTNKDRTITGNVTLSDSKGYIGLATVMNAYGSGSTVYTGVISTTGFTTIVVAPASNRFFIKNLHISSLGRSEVEVRSGATTLIPFTSLSTTSGFSSHFGEMGLPARAQTDALVLNLNGGATISYMANLRFEA